MHTQNITNHSSQIVWLITQLLISFITTPISTTLRLKINIRNIIISHVIMKFVWLVVTLLLSCLTQTKLVSWFMYTFCNGAEMQSGVHSVFKI